MTVATETIETELERVERWRGDLLLRAGFGYDDAMELAGCFEVDLHDAIALVERGCPPDLAISILR